MHLIVVEHEAAASVGRLAPHLVEHRVTTVRPANGDPFPVVADRDDAGGEADNQVDGVIVLGGSMGAYEEFAHPWLIDEKCWIAQVVSAQVPLLGICLGSQLLADATGGRAYRAEGRLEAGVLNLHLTDAGQVDPVVAKAGPRVFAVHGDTFELPPDATLMARTDDYQQAFRIGSALGVQFHPETDAGTAIDWAQSLVGPVLDRAGVTQSEFATQLRDAEDELASAAHNLFAAWLDGVDRRITTPG